MRSIVEEDSQVPECVIKKKITVRERKKKERPLISWPTFPSYNRTEQNLHLLFGSLIKNFTKAGKLYIFFVLFFLLSKCRLGNDIKTTVLSIYHRTRSRRATACR